MSNPPKTKIIDTICDHCGVTFPKRFNLDHNKNKHKHNFCTVKCKNLAGSYYKWSDERKIEYGLTIMGENNPNYGLLWTEEQKVLASITKKKQYEQDPDLAHRCGKTNRGKTISRAIIEKQLETRSKNPNAYDHVRNFSREVKAKIGNESAERWTDPIYATNIQTKARKTMEELGYWTPREKLTSFEIYRRNANWKESMINHLTEDELKIFKEVGMFHPKNNKTGVVRDHRLSRLTGYKLNIPYQLLRHPCNLQLLTFRENSIKCNVDNLLSESSKIDLVKELIHNITIFSKIWKEQQICIEIIRDI